MFVNALPPTPDGRTRYVNRRWLRPPGAPMLRDDPPKGVRTPNDLIWGHDLHDFLWMERFPGISVLTIWSRSMIKELGENYDENEFATPDELQVPRQRHPWPILRLQRGYAAVEEAMGTGGTVYGVIDKGCEKHHRAGYVPKRRKDPEEEKTETQEEDERLAWLIDRVLGIEDGPGFLMRNDPQEPVKDASGRRYTMLWVPEVRESYLAMMAGMPRLSASVTRIIQPRPFTIVKLDAFGVQVLETMDEDALEELERGPRHQRLDEEPTSKAEQVADTDGPAPEGKPDEATERPTAIGDSTKEDASRDEEGEDNEKRPDDSNGVATTEVNDNEVPATAEPSTHAEPRAPELMDQVSARISIPQDSPFSIQDVPKLEEFIPLEYFPDVLHVHDPHQVTEVEQHAYGYYPREKANTPQVVYKRMFPKLARDVAFEAPLQLADGVATEGEPISVPPRIAHLHLAQQNRCGVGHHSLVHRAALTLPSPLTAHSRNGRVVVAAKSAFPIESARQLLQKEAKIYNALPRHLMEDWCGYNLVVPIKHPVPIGPVAPKLYGYYVPVKMVDGKEVLCNEITDCRSPILLLEECGEPVEPAKFTFDARSECYSHMVRLHLAGFIQGSFYVRNILAQPGPLTAPPEKRSKKTPSFRVIDFGRGEQWHEFVGDRSDESRVEQKRVEWGNELSDEDKRAQRELQIENWNY